MKQSRSQLIVAAIFSFLGVILTCYLIYQHYSPPNTSFCNINGFINCDLVNKSSYSLLFGVPVSILGLGTYVFLLILSLGLLFGYCKRRTLILATALSGFGLLFSLYLTIVEFFVLSAVCLFCLGQQFVILALFLLFFSELQKCKER